jgi:tetratricopeptide (TPR) repeat protein
MQFDPPPTPLPAKPLTEAQTKHHQALLAFARGRTLEHQSRYVEAIQAYEQALKLEQQPAIYKALIPLAFALDRDTQALEYCRKAIELDPDDYALLFQYAKETQERGRLDEASEALAKAVKTAGAKEHPAQLAQMLFALATLREELKQYDKAADTYEQVTKILDNPDGLMVETQVLPKKQVQEEAARTYERWGKAEVLAHRFPRALTAFQRAQQLDPQRAGRLQFNLAEVYLAQGRRPEALASLQRYIATQPPGSEAYEMLIDLLTQMRRQGEIIPALEQAAARDQFNQSLKIVLAGQHSRAGDPKKAEAIYLSAMADYPSEEAYRGLAKLYQDQGRWEELAKKLDHDLADPRYTASARPQLAVLSGDSTLIRDVATAGRALSLGGTRLSFMTNRVLATLCRQARQFDLAEFFCRKALPDDPQPGDVYLELCRVLAEAGKHDAEAAVCREAMTKKLKLPSQVFQLELARCLAQAGRDKEAIETARQAVQQSAAGSDEHFQARYSLASVYYRCNLLDQAEQECLRLLEERKAPAAQRQLHYLLSGICTAAKDHARAEAYLQKILDVDPQDATACNDLGYIWADQGKNLEQAEKLIRKAIELDRAARAKRRGGLEIPDADKDNAAYIDSLAWVLFKRRQFNEARELLEQAGKLPTGEDPVIWDHLGDVYLALGRPDKAAEAWEQALRLYDKTRRTGLVDRGQELRNRMKEIRRSSTMR